MPLVGPNAFHERLREHDHALALLGLAYVDRVSTELIEKVDDAADCLKISLNAISLSTFSLGGIARPHPKFTESLL